MAETTVAIVSRAARKHLFGYGRCPSAHVKPSAPNGHVCLDNGSRVAHMMCDMGSIVDSVVSKSVGIVEVPEALREARQALVEHRLLRCLRSLDDWRIFMTCHVFAVWDFMTLLKRLQQDLTCVATPWMPASNPSHTRFVNALVLAEESDEDGRGGFSSHFDLYLRAMADCGADTAPMLDVLRRIQSGVDVGGALAASRVPMPVQRFVQTTMDIAHHGSRAEVAAAFFWGREELIPDLFSGLLQLLQHETGLEKMRYYLTRHIVLDADDHGPMALAMVQDLCHVSHHATEAYGAADRTLRARVTMWDHIASTIEAYASPSHSRFQGANVD